MPARSTHIIFHNKTPFTLTRTNGGLDHGVFTKPFHFIDTIASGQTVDWETESEGIATGTEGFVNYRLGNGPAELHIHWDNPFEGTNKYNEFVSDGFELFHTGGSGNNTIVDFTLAVSVPHVVPGFLPVTVEPRLNVPDLNSSQPESLQSLLEVFPWPLLALPIFHPRSISPLSSTMS